MATSPIFQGPLTVMAKNRTRFKTRKIFTNLGRRRVTTSVLPDDVLIEIFDFCLDLPRDFFDRMNTWKRLAHVCQRWRRLVFQSPRRLDLEFLYTGRIPLREVLDTWPDMHLIVSASDTSLTRGMDDTIAALEHRDRISRIMISNSPLKALLPVMQEPFPALRYLEIFSDEHGETDAGDIPDSFLGRSAPNLRDLHFWAVSCPAIPELLLSAINLVDLTLRYIPHSGYISPEAIVTALSALTRLESFEFTFQSPQSRPDQWQEDLHPPMPMRSVIPALTHFYFAGASEYLEVLVDRVDAPLLNRLLIYVFNEPNGFHTPYLAQFITRVPEFQAPNEARVVISSGDISVTVPSPMEALGRTLLTVSISYSDGDFGHGPSSLAQLCTSSLTPFLTVETLYMASPLPDWLGNKNTQWLELLRPFAAVKNLYLSKIYAPCIAPALQGLIGEGVTEVLPALQNLFLWEKRPSRHVQLAIKQFVCARQLSGHPIVVSRWVVDKDMRWEIKNC